MTTTLFQRISRLFTREASLEARDRYLKAFAREIEGRLKAEEAYYEVQEHAAIQSLAYFRAIKPEDDVEEQERQDAIKRFEDLLPTVKERRAKKTEESLRFVVVRDQVFADLGVA